jgi:hypothetical protein
VDIYAKSATTTLGALIREGLYGLVPELSIERKKSSLQSRVKELREEFFAKAGPASSGDINEARLLAVRCFCDPWARPMLVM